MDPASSSIDVAQALLLEILELAHFRPVSPRIRRLSKQIRDLGQGSVLVKLINSGELPDPVAAQILTMVEPSQISPSKLLSFLESNDAWAKVEALRVLRVLHLPEGLPMLRHLLGDHEEVTDLWTTYRVDRLAALAVRAHEQRDPALQTFQLANWLEREREALSSKDQHLSEDALLFFVRMGEIRPEEAPQKLPFKPSKYFEEELNEYMRTGANA